MERGLPRAVANRNGDVDGSNNRSSDSDSRKTGAAEVGDVQQQLGGGDGGGVGGVGFGGGGTTEDDRRVCSARRVLCTAVKVIVVAALFTATCAFLWYTMGLPFLLQVAAVVSVAFIASGGYKFLYLVYRTAPRDIK